MNEETKTINVTAYPYAVQYGTIEVPKELNEDDVNDYLFEHWNEIKFGEPELDYAGTDFDFNEDC